MENKESFLQPETITKETLPSILAEIASEREKKGSSETLIPRIRRIREQVGKLGDVSTVVQLYQEEFLSASHMVIEEKSRKYKANPIRMAKGFLLMRDTSKTMEKYLTNENLNPVIKARIYRFLGRYSEQKRQYNKSESYYRQGLAYFDSSEKPEERFNRLEFLGFISYSLLKQGRIDEGTYQALLTLKDFDESEEGKWLKENSYQTWAVWKSGIEIRTAEILLSKKTKSTYLAPKLLSDSEKILRMPDGNTEIFRLRLDELDHAKKQLKNI